MIFFTFPLDDFFKKSTIDSLLVLFQKCTIDLDDSEKATYPVKEGQFKRVVFGPGKDFVEGTDDRYPCENNRIVKDFHADYLQKIISSSIESFMSHMEKDLSNPIMHDPNPRYYYVTLQIEKLEEVLVKIEQAEHLREVGSSFKEEIIKNIKLLKEKKLPKLYVEIEENKLKFKLSKKEVCLLFSRISDEGFISSDQAEEKDLGKLIDQHFMYQDSSTKKYYSITSAYKTIQKNRLDPRHQTESEKLKKLLQPKHKK